MAQNRIKFIACIAVLHVNLDIKNLRLSWIVTISNLILKFFLMKIVNIVTLYFTIKARIFLIWRWVDIAYQKLAAKGLKEI